MRPARGVAAADLVDAFAVTAPGLEPLCAAELRALGTAPAAQLGGVSWRGTLESVARANLWSRIASRVVVRLAQFRATSFFELERHARRIAWTRYVAPQTVVEFRVTCRKSRLYHSDAVAQRFAESVQRVVSSVQRAQRRRNDDADHSAETAVFSADERDERRQLFLVRLDHDRCTVSADTSGALLYLRGYRQQLAKAPLRETLAAAVLAGARWTGDSPLVDPMCGSGTIAIEAARLARRIAPGRDRPFAFLSWPEHDIGRWVELVSEARAGELARSAVSIEAYDRDDGAIAATRANAERAGVADDLEIAVQPLSALLPNAGSGLIAINPPYGIRVGETERLRNLYSQIGNIRRAKRPAWRLAMLAADVRLAGHTEPAMQERFRTVNGGIPVRLLADAD